MQRRWSYSKENIVNRNEPTRLEQWDYSQWPKNDYSPTLLTSGFEDVSVDPIEFAKAKIALDSTIRGYLGL